MKNINKIAVVFSRQRTITVDLTIRLGVIVAVVLAVLGIGNYFVVVHQIENNLSNQAQHSVKQLAEILSVPVWTLDRQTIQKIGQSYQQSEDVTEVSILGESNQVFYATTSPPPEQNLMISDADILYNNQRIGSVRISLSTQKIRNAQVSSLATTFLTILFVVLTIHLVSRYILDLYLNQPIGNLRKGINAIAKGQDYSELKPVFQADINEIVQDVNAMSRQIHERIQALKTSEERFRRVMNSISDTIYFVEVTAENEVINQYLSPHVVALTGYSSSSFLSDDRFWNQILMDADDQARVAQRFQRLLQGENGEVEYRLVRSDGTILWVRDSATVEKDGDKTFIYGVVSDVSERKKVEEALRAETIERKLVEAELRKYQEHLEDLVAVRTNELEALNQELESFAYSASHDLRGPLRHVDGYSQVILEDYETQIPAEVVQYLVRMRKSIQHMGQLLDGLLKLSRVSRQPLMIHPVEPRALVQKMIEELSEEQPGRQVRFEVGELPGCQADVILLQQVFANLISNAIKYTLRKDPAVIEIKALRKDENIVYFIRDNGVGFDMQYASKLFGVFQRLNTDKEFEGTGVGLAIVQRIVKRHGGRIWAESAVDQGTTFYFTLSGDGRETALNKDFFQ